MLMITEVSFLFINIQTLIKSNVSWEWCLLYLLFNWWPNTLFTQKNCYLWIKRIVKTILLHIVEVVLSTARLWMKPKRLWSKHSSFLVATEVHIVPNHYQLYLILLMYMLSCYTLEYQHPLMYFERIREKHRKDCVNAPWLW